MSLITNKIPSHTRKITFGNLSVGDEIYKYIFDNERCHYKIVGTVSRISVEKIENDEFLSIDYTYNGIIKSRIFAYPTDYCTIDNLDKPTFTIYSPYNMEESELEDCLRNKSNINYISYELNIK